MQAQCIERVNRSSRDTRCLVLAPKTPGGARVHAPEMGAWSIGVFSRAHLQ
jgi:hypothetical protein